MSRGSLGAVARDMPLLLAAKASPFSLKLLLFFFCQGCPSSGPPYVHSIWVSGAVESLLPLSFGSTEVFLLSVVHYVFKEYAFLMLDASSSGPLVPCDRVVELDDIDNEGIRESILKDVESCFFVKGIPCFVCEVLELSNVIVEVLLLHLELSKLSLGSGLDGSVCVCICEPSDDNLPQIFFSREDSSRYLVN